MTTQIYIKFLLSRHYGLPRIYAQNGFIPRETIWNLKKQIKNYSSTPEGAALLATVQERLQDDPALTWSPWGSDHCRFIHLDIANPALCTEII